MSLLSNANHANYNKLVNVIYNVHYLVINFTLVNNGTPSPKKGSLFTLNWGLRLNSFGDLNLKTEVNSSIYGLCGVEFAVSVPWTVETVETNYFSEL